MRTLRHSTRDSLHAHSTRHCSCRYSSYLKHAFPMDELLPLSCKGTNSFGGVSVTLIDSLDTLAVMGLRQEFAEAVEVQAFRIATTFANCNTFSFFLGAVGCSQHRHHAECKHQVLLPNVIIFRGCTCVPVHLCLSRTALSTATSVFEANIRLMGGLLSAHVLASDEKKNLMPG